MDCSKVYVKALSIFFSIERTPSLARELEAILSHAGQGRQSTFWSSRSCGPNDHVDRIQNDGDFGSHKDWNIWETCWKTRSKISRSSHRATVNRCSRKLKSLAWERGNLALSVGQNRGTETWSHVPFHSYLEFISYIKSRISELCCELAHWRILPCFRRPTSRSRPRCGPFIMYALN